MQQRIDAKKSIIPAAKRFHRTELFVFDLDGTLAESKIPIDSEMDRLFCALLSKRKIAVIGGGKHSLFFEQLMRRLHCPRELFATLFLFPTNATQFYRYRRGKGWVRVYEHALRKGEVVRIRGAFREAFRETGYRHPKKTYGPVIENRGTQVTFSALGQKASVAAKTTWNKKRDVRPKLMGALMKYLPDFEVRRGGLTSIDVTRKGIDKAYGIAQIEAHLRVPRKRMLFVGDAIFPGGNDYAVVRAGVPYVKVRNVAETKRLLTKILGML